MGLADAGDGHLTTLVDCVPALWEHEWGRWSSQRVGSWGSEISAQVVETERNSLAILFLS